MGTRDESRTRGSSLGDRIAHRLQQVCLLFALVLPLAAAVPPRADADGRTTRSAQTTRARSRSTRAQPSRSQRTTRRPARPRLTPAQRLQIQRWHAAPSAVDVRNWSRQSPPPLVFRGRERVSLSPRSDEGGFDAAALADARRALASREGETHDIHPRLVELVYRAVRHFRAPYVHVISGYRNGRRTSRHAQGRAIDFVLPGVSDRRLATFLRPLGYVGVGIYPTSGFVHLDVRQRSYFWSDSSGPGQTNRERPILQAQTTRYDLLARRRGATPVPDLVFDDEDEANAEATDEGSSSDGS